MFCHSRVSHTYSVFRTLLIRYTATPAALLCLVCRKNGHIASACVDQCPGGLGDTGLKWFMSTDDERIRLDHATTSPQLLCQRCNSLDLPSWLKEDLPLKEIRDFRKLRGDDQRVFRDLGTVGSVILREDCCLCRCLFGLIPFPSNLEQHVKIVRSWSIYRLHRETSIDTVDKRSTSQCIAAILEPSRSGLSVAYQVSPFSNALCATSAYHEGSNHPRVGLEAREVSPDSINVDLVREWFMTCETKHPLTCSPQKSESLQKVCLIDVISKLIVPYTARSSEYLALSYVWGGAVQNTPGAGKVGTLLETVPKTIADAMAFVQTIGKQYLWVDSICIDQKNEEHKLQQISIMSEIYQGAYATIVALSGTTANAGIPRVNANSSQKYYQRSCSINGTHLVELGPALDALYNISPWATRGWTYQEAVLSSRCIYIDNLQAHFRCSAMSCSESLDELPSEISPKPRKDASGSAADVMGIPSAGIRDVRENALSVYSTHAMHYSRRKLGFQTDALHAFSGIVQALEKSAYKEGMFWALPFADMDWALLWAVATVYSIREGFPRWSWLSCPQLILLSHADDPQTLHYYPFDLKIWKSSSGRPQKVLERSCSNMTSQRRKSLGQDYISTVLACDDTGALERLSDLELPGSERLLCIESFLLRLSPSDWVHSKTSNVKYEYFRINVCGVSLEIIIRGLDFLGDPIHWNREREFLLLGRHVHEQNVWVHHHFLLVEPKGDVYERVCPIRLSIPRKKLWVMESMKFSRTRILLA